MGLQPTPFGSGGTDKTSTYDNLPDQAQRRCAARDSQALDSDLPTLADALNTIPEADRPAVVAHILALAQMSDARRAAVLTLTRET